MRAKFGGLIVSTRKQAFFCGVRAVSPIILGMIPFALITGISAINVGFSKLEALGMSYIVFAGASQLAAIDLIGQNSPAIVIILTALIINLRFCMYSASLAPHFNGLSLPHRGFLAYILTDQAYAVTIVAFSNQVKTFKHSFYLGAALALWVTWQTGTAVGVFLGALIPPSMSLDFAVPLTFLALLFTTTVNRPAIIAAVTAGILALAVHSLPYNMGLVLAALGGIMAGFLADIWNKNGV